MAQVCARCGVVFRGPTASDLWWCKVDQFYVCRRCWEWECQEGHGKGNANVGKDVATSLILILIIWVFAGTWALMAITDGLRVESFARLEVTPISALPAGGVVKVQGIIADSDPVAFGGREVSTDNGWRWAWSRTDSFRIVDATGEVPTTTNRWWVVEATPHPAPGAVHTAGSVYLPGDTVLVVGNIAGDGADRHIEAFYVSPDTFRQDPWLPLLLGFLGTIPFVVAADLVLRQRHKRLVLHRAAVRDRPVVDVSKDTASRDKSLPWRENPGRMSVRGRLIGTTVAIGAGVVILVVLSTLVLPFSTRAETYLLGWLYALTVFFLVFLPLLGSFASSIRPTAVAITDQGVYFWYNSPYERRLADGFVAWAEIAYIGVRGSGKTTSWVLERKSGAKDDLKVLSAENFNALSLEWKLREGASRDV